MSDPEILTDHIRTPYHRGRLPNATHGHSIYNPACGDSAVLDLRVENGRVLEAWQDGKGCGISQAAASILCEYIEGKPVDELVQLEPHHMLDLLGVKLTPQRRQCGLLALHCLQKMFPTNKSP